MCRSLAVRSYVLATDGALWAASTRPAFLLFGSSWRRLTFAGLALRRFLSPRGIVGGRVLATAVDGSVWVARLAEDDAPEWTWLAFPGGSHVPAECRIAWAVPVENSSISTASREDGRVYINTCDASGTWQGWRVIVETGQSFHAASHSPMVAHRVKGQIEVFAQTREGDLLRTWWS